MENKNKNKKLISKKPSLWQVIGSVMCALFGVQSQKNRERDFTYGSAWKYILIGIIALIAFILGLLKLVDYALIHFKS